MSRLGEGSTEEVGFEFSTESRQQMERCNVIRQLLSNNNKELGSKFHRNPFMLPPSEKIGYAIE